MVVDILRQIFTPTINLSQKLEIVFVFFNTTWICTNEIQEIVWHYDDVYETLPDLQTWLATKHSILFIFNNTDIRIGMWNITKSSHKIYKQNFNSNKTNIRKRMVLNCIRIIKFQDSCSVCSQKDVIQTLFK